MRREIAAVQFGRFSKEKMKVALASHYRLWMYALFPVTLGVGTAALWARALDWPLDVDADGLTLRHHRRLPWNAIGKISVRRDYCDGRISRLDIHHDHRISKIPISALHCGEEVAEVILTSFKHAQNDRTAGPLAAIAPRSASRQGGVRSAASATPM
jgi:hypothetical protein